MAKPVSSGSFVLRRFLPRQRFQLWERVFTRETQADLTHPDGILKLSAVFAINPLRRPAAILIGGLLAISALFAFQKPFREYPGLEYEKFPLPPDYVTEFRPPSSLIKERRPESSRQV